jgi:uncharacterized sulfatase
MSTEISRRGFLAGTSAGVVAAGLAGSGATQAFAEPVRKGKARAGAPNVILILVDEMRFPMTFPAGIKTPEQFLEKFMPNLAKLRKRGVKFSNHYTSGTACRPARACLVTGLYPHQNWRCKHAKVTNPDPMVPMLQRYSAISPLTAK